MRININIPFPPTNDSLIYKGDMDTTAYKGFLYTHGMHRMDYSGNIIYYDFEPERILFDGGYVTFVNNRPAYHFYLTDHQGNVRMVVSADGAVEETNHYYPFGALFGESAGGSKQRYKYNGKELERLLALDWCDYGARWYDPVLARWHAVDPLANEAPGTSPYVYCNNNAVNAVDPDGRMIVLVYYTNSNQLKSLTIEGPGIYLHPKNQFVSDFFKAYNFNVRNGGGKFMKQALNDPIHKYYIYDATDSRAVEKQVTEFNPQNGKSIITWESRVGLRTTEGGHQSAATRLEHEFYHAIDNTNSPSNRREKSAFDGTPYESKGEKEAIEAENETAIKNGEDIRKNHKGTTYETISPISTKSKYKVEENY